MFTKLIMWFQGRHTFFIVASFTVGGVLSWFHRLDPSLVTLILGLQGMVLMHSVKESLLPNQ